MDPPPLDIERLSQDAAGERFELYREHIGPAWAKMLRTIGFERRYTRCEGPYLFDEDGNKYLDFMSGWGVFNFGRNHPTIQRALQDVLRSDAPGWVAFDTPPLAGVLARELLRRMPPGLSRVYFCNSGAESVEAALKFARVATGKHGIVHLKRAFHGMTTGALSVNGDAHFRDGFEPFLPGGIQVELNDDEALERAFSAGGVAAFIFEPVQGKGVYLPDDGFLLRAQELCRAHGALLICDEVQTGLGRTGRFLACEWVAGLEPDVVLLAKALSGGYVPVGAMLTRREVHDRVFTSMKHGMRHACTFGMGNMAMAAGLASLHVLEHENLIENARRMGELLRRGLEAMLPRFDFLKAVRVRGLMIGIEFGKPRSLKLRSAWSMIHGMDRNLFPQAIVIPLFDDHRILTQTAGHELDIIKLLPPLNITEADVRWFLEAFEQTLARLHRFPGPAWEVFRKLGKFAVGAKPRGAVAPEPQAQHSD